MKMYTRAGQTDSRTDTHMKTRPEGGRRDSKDGVLNQQENQRQHIPEDTESKASDPVVRHRWGSEVYVKRETSRRFAEIAMTAATRALGSLFADIFSCLQVDLKSFKEFSVLQTCYNYVG